MRCLAMFCWDIDFSVCGNIHFSVTDCFPPAAFVSLRVNIGDSLPYSHKNSRPFNFRASSMREN